MDLRYYKKRWVIIMFPDSFDYSIIPKNWILKCVGHGNMVVKCVWPLLLLHVTSDILQETVDPSEDSCTYSTKLNENERV